MKKVGKGYGQDQHSKDWADFAYTLDGGEAESQKMKLSAPTGPGIVVTHGVIVHPGYTKDKLKNAIKMNFGDHWWTPQNGMEPGNNRW